jgi:hypothetical protein
VRGFSAVVGTIIIYLNPRINISDEPSKLFLKCLPDSFSSPLRDHVHTYKTATVSGRYLYKAEAWNLKMTLMILEAFTTYSLKRVTELQSMLPSSAQNRPPPSSAASKSSYSTSSYQLSSPTSAYSSMQSPHHLGVPSAYKRSTRITPDPILLLRVHTSTGAGSRDFNFTFSTASRHCLRSRPQIKATANSTAASARFDSAFTNRCCTFATDESPATIRGQVYAGIRASCSRVVPVQHVGGGSPVYGSRLLDPIRGLHQVHTFQLRSFFVAATVPSELYFFFDSGSPVNI